MSSTGFPEGEGPKELNPDLVQKLHDLADSHTGPQTGAERPILSEQEAWRSVVTDPLFWERNGDKLPADAVDKIVDIVRPYLEDETNG